MSDSAQSVLLLDVAVLLLLLSHMFMFSSLFLMLWVCISSYISYYNPMNYIGYSLEHKIVTVAASTPTSPLRTGLPPIALSTS